MIIACGYLLLAITIGIIIVVGADAAYKIARSDYERDMEQEIADRIAHAHVETRVVIQWIDE